LLDEEKKCKPFPSLIAIQVQSLYFPKMKYVPSRNIFPECLLFLAGLPFTKGPVTPLLSMDSDLERARKEYFVF
jgi:hypothetical protein